MADVVMITCFGGETSELGCGRSYALDFMECHYKGVHKKFYKWGHRCPHCLNYFYTDGIMMQHKDLECVHNPLVIQKKARARASMEAAAAEEAEAAAEAAAAAAAEAAAEAVVAEMNEHDDDDVL